MFFQYYFNAEINFSKKTASIHRRWTAMGDNLKCIFSSNIYIYIYIYIYNTDTDNCMMILRNIITHICDFTFIEKIWYIFIWPQRKPIKYNSLHIVSNHDHTSPRAFTLQKSALVHSKYDHRRSLMTDGDNLNTRIFSNLCINASR